MKSLFLVPQRVTQGYGKAATAKLQAWYGAHGLAGHEGIDLVPVGPSWGVHALFGGKVIVDNDDPTGRDYGNSIRILSDDGTVRLYAHLSENTVRIGDTVRAGQLIGIMGASSGTLRDMAAHLHYGKYKVDGAGRTLNLDNGVKGWVNPQEDFE
jgi:murein DD-endopeptidase MepM/ murein hydrolase activator NlpD